MTIDVMELAYIGVEASDLEAWESFAVQILGTPLSSRGEDGTLYLRVDKTHHRIAVHPSDEDGLRYIGFSVRDSRAFDKARQALESASVAVQPGTDSECADRRVQEMLVFEDPSGHRVEIVHGQLWRVEEPIVRPTRPLAGLRALGHVVLTVPGARELRDFYINVLGFRLTDYRSDAIYFLRCNARHHSLAIAETVERKVHHFFLEVESVDDVGLTDDLARANGISIASIGRHGNDRAISCYIETPSGFQVEYGCGGIQIEEDEWTAHEYTVGDLWGHHRSREEDIVLTRTHTAE